MTGSKISCDDCYFKCHGLCAVTRPEPCASFRPNRPEGLRPPRQLRFDFRRERRLRASWSFPSASEQLALHS